MRLLKNILKNFTRPLAPHSLTEFAAFWASAVLIGAVAGGLATIPLGGVGAIVGAISAAVIYPFVAVAGSIIRAFGEIQNNISFDSSIFAQTVQKTQTQKESNENRQDNSLDPSTSKQSVEEPTIQKTSLLQKFTKFLNPKPNNVEEQNVQFYLKTNSPKNR